MMVRNGLLAAAAAAGLLFVAGLDASAQAPKTSACKGLAEAACKAKTTCGWVAPKTGKQKPYCRSKPAKKK